MATNCPRTRPSWIGAIIKKASKGAREHYSSVHADPDPLDIPPFGTIMKNSYLEWYNRCLHQGHWLSIWQWRGHQLSVPEQFYSLICRLHCRGPQTCINYLICTVAKKGCVRICVSLATFSIIPRVFKPPPIWCGLATVPIFVADFHHSATICLSIFDGARLGDNAWHMRTWGTG